MPNVGRVGMRTTWSYTWRIVRNAIRPGSLVVETIGVGIGLAGLAANATSRPWMVVYFVGLFAFLVIWNTYRVGLNLHAEVRHAHRIQQLLKSRASLRAHEKRREVFIDEVGERDRIETVFRVEAVSLPVKKFYVRLQTDRQDYVINRQQDWDFKEGQAVRADMYKIDRKYAEFIVEHELFRAIFKGDPRELHVTHRADLVDPAADWVGVDIIEETLLATLRAWLPPGWRPNEETIERYKMKDGEEIPLKGPPKVVRFDEAKSRWLIEDTFADCELFVSYCIRWQAVKETDEQPPPRVLSQLAPRGKRAKQ